MRDTFFSERIAPRDILARLDKRTPYMGMPTGTSGALIYSGVIVLSVGILLPIYFSVILPVVAVYVGATAVYRRVTYKPEVQADEGPLPAVDLSATSVPPIESREFDVVVFGVTGLCGRITAEYLLYRYSDKLKLAFAGRSQAKLQTVRAELAQRTGVANGNDVPLIECDSDDLPSLLALARRTKVVATTVGPYNKYGEKLVRACAYSGTGYCDLTGEQDFVSNMARKYDGIAKATGARIVHLTGVDSVPSEIMATLVSEGFKAKYGHAPTRVEHVLFAGVGGLPGGTVDTLVTSLDNMTKPKPKAARPSGVRIPAKGETRVSPFIPQYLSSVQGWGGPWFMGPINSRSVQRSNALAGFAPRLQYVEMQKFPSLLSVIAMAIPMAVGLTAFVLPPVQKLLFSTGMLPKPGEGAMSRQQMARGYMRFQTTAMDTQGNKLAMTFGGLGDPGCIITALLQGECAATLAEDFNKTPLKGAGLTPVAVLGAERLKGRLNDTGRIAIV